MHTYRSKPVVIQAVEWNGDNYAEITDWADDVWAVTPTNGLVIPTLEGDMTASLGDWIIKGTHGEFYPCKPEVFAFKYESAYEGPG